MTRNIKEAIIHQYFKTYIRSDIRRYILNIQRIRGLEGNERESGGRRKREKVHCYDKTYDNDYKDD